MSAEKSLHEVVAAAEACGLAPMKAGPGVYAATCPVCFHDGQTLTIAAVDGSTSATCRDSCDTKVIELTLTPPDVTTTTPIATTPGKGRRIELTPASAIRMERVHWLWEGRIPRRAVVVVAGEKGLGKSMLTGGHLVAGLTLGEVDGESHGEPLDVAIANAEDDWPSVIKPRLVAHGADCARVHRLKLTDDAGASLLTLPDDVQALDEAILASERRTGRHIGVLVIDPITAFLSTGIDSHKDASVRRAIAPLASLAERRDLSVVVVAHLTKDENARVLARVSGSGAFVNAARSVLIFARDPNDPLGERGVQRVLVMAASNWGTLAPSLAAHIETVTVELDDGPSEQPLLVNDGETDVHASDLGHGEAETSNDDVSDAILVSLRGGPLEAREVKGQVSSELDVSRRTVERGASRLEDDGLLIRSESGFPAVATWAVAPPLDTSGVATGGNGATAGVSPTSGDSSDTVASPEGGATDEPEQLSLADRFAADRGVQS